MKKRILAIAIAVIGVLSCSAQSYRGFLNAELGIVDISEPGFGANLTMTHGVQLGSKFFLGAGSGISYSSAYFSSGLAVPVYADFRFDFWGDNSWSPFVDLRAGYMINVSEYWGCGFMVSPTIGMRKRINDRRGLNIGLTYMVSEAECYDYYYYGNLEVFQSIFITIGIDF